MIEIFACILVGILVGFLSRERSYLKQIGTIMSVVIGLLLFSLGISVGSNDQIVNNFGLIGLDAFLLTVGGTVGSLFCAKWIYTRFFKKERTDS